MKFHIAAKINALENQVLIWLNLKSGVEKSKIHAEQYVSMPFTLFLV